MVTDPTTLVLPPWLPWLLVCALCTAFALCTIHQIAWPGRYRLKPLKVWQTQVIGTGTLWIGLTVFWVPAFNNWIAPFALGVFVVFSGIGVLGLRILHDYSDAKHYVEKATKESNV